MAAYSATKAMQLSASRSLAEVTRGSGVTVNAVMPGTTRSAGLDAKLRERYPELEIQEASARFAREERPTSLIAAPDRAVGDRRLRDLRGQRAGVVDQRRRPARRRRHRAPHALSALNRTSAAVSGAGARWVAAESATQDT